MNIVNSLEQSVPNIIDVEEDPTPITQTIELASRLYTKLCTTQFSNEEYKSLQRSLWELMLIRRNNLAFIIRQQGKSYKLSFLIFLCLSRVIILQTLDTPQTTASDIVGLELSLYYPELKDKKIGEFTMKECIDSISLIGSGFSHCVYHPAIERLITILERRICEFCHYSMPLEEYDEDDFCSPREHEGHTFGMVAIELIQRVQVILFQIRFRLQAIYIMKTKTSHFPVDISKPKQKRLHGMIMDIVAKMPSAESGKTMRQHYIASQIRPGEREIFEMANEKRTGYETDQEIFLYFRGEAEFFRMFEYCGKSWSSLVQEEYRVGTQESIGLQMCLFDIICLIVQSQVIPRKNLHEYMVWESEIPSRYTEIIHEQEQKPIMIQAFNHVQLVYKGTMYMLNSMIKAFIAWLHIVTHPNSINSREEEEEMVQEGITACPDEFKCEYELWMKLEEDTKLVSSTSGSDIPTGFIAFH